MSVLAAAGSVTGCASSYKNSSTQGDADRSASRSGDVAASHGETPSGPAAKVLLKGGKSGHCIQRAGERARMAACDEENADQRLMVVPYSGYRKIQVAGKDVCMAAVSVFKRVSAVRFNKCANDVSQKWQRTEARALWSRNAAVVGGSKWIKAGPAFVELGHEAQRWTGEKWG
ncbi:hypothetical protein [Streptomyces sp. NPDC093707]|uniref:hypothetical protein n=2 Tax=unclassified Streptomyces TaxID=2593676 RepID=UPI00345015A9